MDFFATCMAMTASQGNMPGGAHLGDLVVSRVIIRITGVSNWFLGLISILWVLPPLTNTWIIKILWLYVALYRTPHINCYWVGQYPKHTY